MKSRIKIIFFTAFFLLNILNVYAQDSSNQLVISEAKFDLKNKDVWIEVFNPSDNPIVLSSLRLSWVRSTNSLPPGISNFKVEPGKRLIICSDSNSFADKYGHGIKLIEVKPLIYASKGGFIKINHLDGAESSKNIIRFGEKSLSANLADKVRDNEVINITEDGMSYSRDVKKNGEISTWSKAIPTPGK